MEAEGQGPHRPQKVLFHLKLIFFMAVYVWHDRFVPISRVSHPHFSVMRCAYYASSNSRLIALKFPLPCLLHGLEGHYSAHQMVGV